MADDTSRQLREPLIQTPPKSLELPGKIIPDLYLLVISHPDDESMFFSPTIRSLLSALRSGGGAAEGGRKPPKVSVLSLSNGGYDGLGRIRAVELWRAASALGLLWWDLHGEYLGNDDDNDDGEGVVAVLDDDRMKDGPDEVWDENVVADAVLRRIMTLVGVEVPHPDGSRCDDGAEDKPITEDSMDEVVTESCPVTTEGGISSDDETATAVTETDDRECGPSHPRSAVIMTFDSGGVSGHPNHIATHKGVRQLLRLQARRRQFSEVPSSPKDSTESPATKEFFDDRLDCLNDISLCGYELVTVRNPVIKYFPFLDMLWMLLAFLFRVALFLLGLTTTWSAADSPLPATVAFVPTNDDPNRESIKKKAKVTCSDTVLTYRTFEPHIVWSAMAAHASQFVWYRRLSVLFSRYTFWNELRLIAAVADGDSSNLPADLTEEGSLVESSSSVKEAEVTLPDVSVIEEPEAGEGGYAVPPPFLTRMQMRRIAETVLPPAIRSKRWTRLYSLARDGDAFSSFLVKVKGAAPSLLVVKTTRGDIFGAYADSSWEPHGNCFYGGGMACLWRIRKEVRQGDETLQVFRWSGLNQCVQLCDPIKGKIAMGGGGKEGEFGLCLSGDFLRGTTGQCETFKNEPLCENERGIFDVLDAECWGFLPGYS